jgi:peroxiredoxin
VRKGVFDILPWVGGVVLLALNVILLQQNHLLRSASSSGTLDAPSLVEGKHLGRSLAAATLDNAFRPIPFPAANVGRTLLITFSPGCPHCRANHRNWSLIAKELRRTGGWRVLWISRDQVDLTKDYCEDSGIPFEETFADPTHRTYVLLDLRIVPNTVVVDEKGIVEKIWPGELDATGWKNVFSYLHMPPAITPIL